ncbi:hypothetical protein M9458_040180, partial [Cirrhinus mrigala]
TVCRSGQAAASDPRQCSFIWNREEKISPHPPPQIPQHAGPEEALQAGALRQGPDRHFGVKRVRIVVGEAEK